MAKRPVNDPDAETARTVDALLRKLPYANADPDDADGRERAGGARPQQSIVINTYRAPKPTPLAVWWRLVLALLLSGAIVRWPYPRDCGWLLIGYGVSVLVIFACVVWASAFAWRAHLVLPHLITQVLLLWTLVLAAEVVLPRVGYARASASWSCSGARPAEQPTTSAPALVVPTPTTGSNPPVSQAR